MVVTLNNIVLIVYRDIKMVIPEVETSDEDIPETMGCKFFFYLFSL